MQHTKFSLQVLREDTSVLIILHTVSYFILTEVRCRLDYLIIYVIMFKCSGLTTCTYIPMKYSLHKQIILFYLHSVLFTLLGPFQVDINLINIQSFTFLPLFPYLHPICLLPILHPQFTLLLHFPLRSYFFSHSWGKGRDFFPLYPCSIVFTFMLILLNT